MPKLFRNTLYFRRQADRLRALHVESGQARSEPPRLAKGRRVPLAR